MKKIIRLFIITGTAILILFSCDDGLSPDESTPSFTGISGTVYFQNWPAPGNAPPDSMADVRLILFPDFPPSSIQDEIISGRAIVYPGLNENKLTFYIDSLNFQIPLTPGTYEYFSVAHQYGPNLFQDWRVVGHYDTTPQDTLPTSLTITSGQHLEDIFILADFDSVLFSL
jgi:hypothetical protein